MASRKMVLLDVLFKIEVARSHDTDDYSSGTIPFVTSTVENNGVVRYVLPQEEDKVFAGPCVVISGLGYATVQRGEFLPKGNGGDSMTVLVGHKKMGLRDYLFYAAAFNLLHQWRFTYGRKTSKDRLKLLSLPEHASDDLNNYLGARSKADAVLDELLAELRK